MEMMGLLRGLLVSICHDRRNDRLRLRVFYGGLTASPPLGVAHARRVSGGTEWSVITHTAL
jgi:hypothetical protein